MTFVHQEVQYGSLEKGCTVKEKIDTRGVPQYVRIREDLRRAIDNGTYKVGDAIPSEPALAEEYDVSRMTARQAVTELVDEGLLVRRPGLGTFVQHPRYVRRSSRLTSFYEEAVDTGRAPYSRVLGLECIPATGAVATALDLEEGDLVIRSQRLRFMDGVPTAIHDAYMPYELYPGLLDRTDLAHESLYAIYESQGYRITKGRDRISARMPTDEQRELLQMEPNQPLIVVERITYAQDDIIVEFVKSFVRADRYVYEVEVLR